MNTKKLTPQERLHHEKIVNDYITKATDKICEQISLRLKEWEEEELAK